MNAGYTKDELIPDMLEVSGEFLTLAAARYSHTEIVVNGKPAHEAHFVSQRQNTLERLIEKFAILDACMNRLVERGYFLAHEAEDRVKREGKRRLLERYGVHALPGELARFAAGHLLTAITAFAAVLADSTKERRDLMFEQVEWHDVKEAMTRVRLALLDDETWSEKHSESKVLSAAQFLIDCPED